LWRSLAVARELNPLRKPLNSARDQRGDQCPTLLL
jgi:hypothetical protein